MNDSAYRLPRLTFTILFALLLIGLVYLIHPEQTITFVYKLSLVTAAAVIGYWIDRAVFPYARPDSYLETPDWKYHLQFFGKNAQGADIQIAEGYELVYSLAMLRRAIIIAAIVLGVGLGL
ncbi:putative holin [Leeia sp. TBRC 13508]|uniref:Holin n=1 Tax=Leeia speluncae TaxID=2884804 RepID=A0ABS8D2B3_9NEIS|nr:putative holin [Leeia speluncae]MCB6182332.1 putative holin [Leeia speluncae]